MAPLLYGSISADMDHNQAPDASIPDAMEHHRGHSQDTESLLPTDLKSNGADESATDDDTSSLNSSSALVPTPLSSTQPLGTATIFSETINIAKNLIGSGVLSLSGGIAIYSNDPSALVSASLWIVLLSAAFAYFSIIIAKVCQMTGATSYRGCWEATVGRKGSWIVSLVQMLPAAIGDVAYATVLSQTLQSLLQSVGINWDRITCLLLITLIAVLPLCLMKSLHNLAPFSAAGVASVGIVLVAMLVRCLDGSYNEGGQFHNDISIDHRPEFGHENHAFSTAVLPFACMVYQGLLMHYNSPRFFVELKDPTIPRFAQSTVYAFGLCTCLYIAIAAAGYLTFGSNSDSYILNNYSPNDPLATVGRLCVVFSTVITYPLAFFGVRDGCLDLLDAPQEWRDGNAISVILLIAITVVAMLISDLGFINAVAGGLFCTLLCCVIPAIMYRRAVWKSLHKTRGQRCEVLLVLTLMVLGVLLGGTGVYKSIARAFQ